MYSEAGLLALEVEAERIWASSSAAARITYSVYEGVAGRSLPLASLSFPVSIMEAGRAAPGTRRSYESGKVPLSLLAT